jgi:hypothetical protein
MLDGVPVEPKPNRLSKASHHLQSANVPSQSSQRQSTRGGDKKSGSMPLETKRDQAEPLLNPTAECRESLGFALFSSCVLGEGRTPPPQSV